MEMRHAANLGAANVREVFDALKTGGFKFDAKNATNAQRGLRRLLMKKSSTFHKLYNGTYGLRGQYQNVRSNRNEPTDASPTANRQTVKPHRLPKLLFRVTFPLIVKEQTRERQNCNQREAARTATPMDLRD